MEINFKQKLTEDFLKLKTDKEKRVYLEMINFFAEADENDYKNYYTHKILNDSDFYSVVDILYNLDNFYMLEDFLRNTATINLSAIFLTAILTP